MNAGLGRPVPRAARSHGAALRLDGRVAEKTYFSEWEARLERIKSCSAHELAESTGTFRVPPVISSTPTSTTWQQIPGITPLRRELSRHPRLDLAHRAGRVLATIHEGLDLPNQIRIPASGRWATDRGVPVHGDFGLTNVQYQSDSGELVVLDWATAGWLGSPFTHAHANLDVAMFLADLYYQRPGDPLRIRDTELVASGLLSGYSEVTTLDIVRLRSDVRHLAAKFLWRAQTGFRRGLRAPSLVRLDRFLQASERPNAATRFLGPGSGR